MPAFTYQDIAGVQVEVADLTLLKQHCLDAFKLEAKPMNVRVSQVRMWITGILFLVQHLAQSGFGNVGNRHPAPRSRNCDGTIVRSQNDWFSIRQASLRSRVSNRQFDFFVIRTLRHQLALHGEGEDGFAEVGGGDGVGAVEEEVEVGRGGSVSEAGQRGAGEVGVPGVALGLLRLEPITQRHEFIHLRHNPLLLGEGWEGDRKNAKITS